MPTRSTLHYFGAGRDRFGMPVPFNAYQILAVPWQMKGSGVASILTVSGRTPPQENHIVLKGGAQAAAAVAEAYLDKFHRGLSKKKS